jgi:putative addiction module component (TIGR02574 family)
MVVWHVEQPTKMEEHMQTTGHSEDFDFSALTVPERIDLAQRLWESVREQMESAPLSEMEATEIRRRIERIDSGLMVCEPFDAVMARAMGR